MSDAWIVLIVVAVILVFLVLIYNRLVALRQTYKSAYADIDVQVKQRHDLIPNLVETVKGYAAHESGVLQKVTEARTAAMRAGSMQERGQAESALSSALGRVFAVAEAYPELKANENFRQLQSELEEIENKIAAARRFYNNAVAEYNTHIEQFPAALIAGMTGFISAEMWALEASERTAASEPPKVSFGS
jgi:LemA protein